MFANSINFEINVLKSLPFVNIYMFILIKATSSHEGNLRAKRIVNFGT